VYHYFKVKRLTWTVSRSRNEKINTVIMTYQPEQWIKKSEQSDRPAQQGKIIASGQLVSFEVVVEVAR
jgi:hypothetical protein